MRRHWLPIETETLPARSLEQKLGVAVAKIKYLLMMITQNPAPAVRQDKYIVRKRVTEIVPVGSEELPTGAKCSLSIPRHRDLP